MKQNESFFLRITSLTKRQLQTEPVNEVDKIYKTNFLEAGRHPFHRYIFQQE